ncbi:SpoIIE family protein phosphatase [Streptomyces sp. Babs14]|uniref:SpoIIE family protein phosphatase n=1 Tax=unclassified Streptomyces TaxID=2593676 RepID=UPI001C23759E|nr:MULTISPECIES: SpoIIE family protein phosphatase [unclassified Streptomyces]MBU8547700.1 SpoIIE family protein phosphatase [Streptomyces sp. Osf17]MBU8554468.1 SpoIIE family protein phosphatase [Streptomyces sp. Babs14]
MNRYNAGTGPVGPDQDGAVSEPSGLLDLLGVAAAVLDDEGRITLWSPEAERLFGYSSAEALGRYAADLLIDPLHRSQVLDLFARVLSGESWAGGFPIRCKDGTVRQTEFRNVPLQDDQHHAYALGIATDQKQLRELETGLALTSRLFHHAPFGVAVLDPDLRYMLVNPVLEKIHGKPAGETVGRHPSEVIPVPDTSRIEAAMHRVLATGEPLLNQSTLSTTPSDPDPRAEHAWSASYYRLQDQRGHILGVAVTVVDDTERHRAAAEAGRVRGRLATLAEAGMRIGSSLDLDRTAHELADIAVDDLADVAAVDVLDVIFTAADPAVPDTGQGTAFRPLAVAARPPTDAVRAADPVGESVIYAADRLVTQCVRTGRPVLVPHLTAESFRRLGTRPDSGILDRAGAHSYLAVPLRAHGCVLGALSLLRVHDPRPFDEDDRDFAVELADRAAICVDNARWYRHERDTALALQRSLLPHRAPDRPGLGIATRYRPADDTSEIGGDWYDVLPLAGDGTALVIGDVMGSGATAAATMGQLRTATRALARLDLPPGAVLSGLDSLAEDLDSSFATCTYLTCRPAGGTCEIATAGHLPPVVIRPDGTTGLIDPAPGPPLGIGGTTFTTHRFTLAPGSRVLLYTDGLVETRTDPIDDRLQLLLDLLTRHAHRELEDTCDLLLEELRHPGSRDDVALLLASLT